MTKVPLLNPREVRSLEDSSNDLAKLPSEFTVRTQDHRCALPRSCNKVVVGYSQSCANGYMACLHLSPRGDQARGQFGQTKTGAKTV